MKANRLPDARWRHMAGLGDLVAVLGGDDGDTRFVGGIVRDTMLGIDAADIDLATRLSPVQVIERLAAARIKVVPTGLAHGTVTAVVAGGPVEVTTLRRDVATDGRHATVTFTDDWQEDAARRDFTINALYADPVDGVIYDYFSGLSDLAQGRVRFIGDALRRIAEDHLRILRFFRFHARFGKEPDAEGLAACAARANDLMALSRERIAGELLRLLVAPNTVPVVRLMMTHRIFTPILPEIENRAVARLAQLCGREAQFGITPDPVRRLAALLPQDIAVAEQVGARLKLSNASRKRLISAATPLPAAAPRALAYRLGVDYAIDRLLLGGGDVAPLADWVPPGLPISGGALVARGVEKGPDVARLLRQIEDAWIAEGFPTGERVEQIADLMTDQLLRSIRNA